MKFFQIHDTFNILTRNHFQIHKKIQICELFKIREIVIFLVMNNFEFHELYSNLQTIFKFINFSYLAGEAGEHETELAQYWTASASFITGT